MDLKHELLAVRERHGGVLTAEYVVEDATPAESPLHTQLEWDNDRAGHEYRLIQAARLIRVVRERIVDDAGIRDIRFFVSVPQESGAPRRAYEPAREAAADAFKARVLLAEMERDWLVFRRRWQDFAGFREMVLGDISDAE